MKIGINNILDLKIGSVNINEVRIGSALVWSKAFDPDYQAVLNTATALGYTLPDTSNQVSGNSLVVALKSAGIWNKLDVLYVPATSGDQNFATLNWKNPALFQLTLVNSPIFVSRVGFQGGSGPARYLDTNYNFQTNIGSSKYQQDNAHRMAFLTRSSSTSNVISIDGTAVASVNRMVNANSTVQRLNSSVNITGSTGLNGTGFKALSRSTSNDLLIISEGFTTARTVSSVAVPNDTQSFFRSSTAYGDSAIGVYSMGENIDSDYPMYSVILKNYIASLNNTFEPEYQAVLDYATLQGYQLPSSFSQYLQNNAVKDLKAAGLWNKMDILHVYSNDASTWDFALINWKNPSTHYATPVNSSWVHGQGVLFNVNGYIDTNWNPTLHGVKYTLNDACFTVKTRGLNQTIIGTATTLEVSIRGLATTNNFINSTNALLVNTGVGGTASRGMSRYNSTDIAVHSLTIALSPSYQTTTQTSTTMPNDTLTIGRQLTNYGNGNIVEHFFAGESFTDSQWVEAQKILNGLGGY